MLVNRGSLRHYAKMTMCEPKLIIYMDLKFYIFYIEYQKHTDYDFSRFIRHFSGSDETSY